MDDAANKPGEQLPSSGKPAQANVDQSAGKPADWDASTYGRVSTPQQEWAVDVLQRLELKGDETVVDAGCGSGNVTLALLEALPDGEVIAVDGSPAMVEAARERVGTDRVEYSVQDLTHLKLDRQVDGIFSNATFHWIPDHKALFHSLFDVLKPGGRFVAQCGGRGNVTDIQVALQQVCTEEPFADYISELASPWNFAGPEETEIRLTEAGFTDPECWLEERVAMPQDPLGFMRASTMAPQLEALPAELHEQYVDRFFEIAGHPEHFNYVRLNMVAGRP